MNNLPAVRNHRIEYKIGADPELFIVDTETGQPVSAHDVVPGTKHNPVSVSLGAIQADGTAAEFNIEPASGSLEFTRNIRMVVKQMNEIIRKKNEKFQLRAFPVAMYDKDYFDDLPPEALQFGCDPDFQAWNDGEEQEFKGTDKPMRTGAGHVHVGWTEGQALFDHAHFYDCIQAVKQLDASLYFASLLWDSDEVRRTLYGKMGSFRPKSYGVEYRPLSNVWVGNTQLHAFIFRFVNSAMNLLDYHDIKLFEDSKIKEMITMVQNGHTPSRSDLVNFHRDLNHRFGMPKLPEAYLKIPQEYSAPMGVTQGA